MVMHFKNQQDRLDFLNGKYEEIILPKVKSESKTVKNEQFDAQNEKKSQNKAQKRKKSAKEDKADGKTQAK
jgi:hypothetical protein